MIKCSTSVNVSAWWLHMYKNTTFCPLPQKAEMIFSSRFAQWMNEWFISKFYNVTTKMIVKYVTVLTWEAIRVSCSEDVSNEWTRMKQQWTVTHPSLKLKYITTTRHSHRLATDPDLSLWRSLWPLICRPFEEYAQCAHSSKGRHIKKKWTKQYNTPSTSFETVVVVVVFISNFNIK